MSRPVRVEIQSRPEARDTRGKHICRQAAALGIAGLRAVEVSDLYFLDGPDLYTPLVDRLVDSLLCDPVIQRAVVGPQAASRDGIAVEVAFRGGVTDSVAESLLAAADRAGIPGLSHAASGRRYVLHGDLDRPTVERLARGLLANEVVETVEIGAFVTPPFGDAAESDGRVDRIPLTALAPDALEALSAERRLSLDRAEMLAIQAHYQAAGREPTDLELETLAQTWSEHCVHKTFRAEIALTTPDGTRTIDGLLKTFIRGATEKAAKPWVRSAFVDNAGIVAFDDAFDLAFKVETHNHPSALEPFGGANTGVGGVVRDVIGVSARPIATTDILCFGPEDQPHDTLPSGVLHPRRIRDGVIAGIEDYGNKMGIPTVSGALVYDPGYTANPLVFCGCLGLLPTGSHPTSPQPGDRVIVIGGRTGRDGLRGATFSSMEMSHETGTIAGTAVQIGHPIHEKQVLEVVLEARDRGLYTAITDCGAGGLSSSVGEMGATLGAAVALDRVPLKYPGLRPWEIWLSEAQERMVLAVPQAALPALGDICAVHGVEMTDLGHFTGDGHLRLTYRDRPVGDLDVAFLHHGIPRQTLPARWDPPAPAAAEPPDSDLGADLLALLGTPDIRSKEEVVRRYDHEVQGGTVVKPLVGARSDGPGDATVLAPLEPMKRALAASLPIRGVALSVGLCPTWSAVDPYAMAFAAVDEAVRNAVAVGADPDHLSLLDNFSWGNPRLPDRLASLCLAAEGCHDAAVAYGAPFVSGKDSLNNEYTGADGQRHAIPGTLVISAIGIVPDIAATVTMDLKAPGDRLYLIGHLDATPGASAWYRLHGLHDTRLPGPPDRPLARARALHQAIRHGAIRACHDVSEGGLLLTVAEMALAGDLGAQIALPPHLSPGLAAFAEALGCWVVAVAPDHVAAFEAALTGHPVTPLGAVTTDASLRTTCGRVNVPVALLRDAWRGHVARAEAAEG